MSTAILSHPVTARLFTRFGANCLKCMSCVKYDQQDQQDQKEKKGTWKIGLIAGHAAGLPPGIKEGPYLGMIVKKWKK